jgi:hypothetical protein
VALRCIKDGADLRGLSPEILDAAFLTARVFGAFGCPFVVTSGLDGEHMTGSKHYSGNAVDIRLPTWYGRSEATNDTVLAEIRLAVGKDYDVVYERDHYHVEYDPKNGRIA